MNKSPNLVQSKSMIEKYSSHHPFHIEQFTALNLCASCSNYEVVNDLNQCACNSNQYFRDMVTNNCVDKVNPCGSDTKYYQVNTNQLKLEEIQIRCYNCSNNEITTFSKSNCYCPSQYFRNSNYPYQCDYASNICTSNQSYTTISDFGRGEYETRISCSNCGLYQIRDSNNYSQCACVSGRKQTYKIEINGSSNNLGCKPDSNPCENTNYYWTNNYDNTITCRQCSNIYEIGVLNGCVCNSNTNLIRRGNDETCVANNANAMCSGIPSGYLPNYYSFTSNSSLNDYLLMENTVTCTYCGSNQERSATNPSQCKCINGYFYDYNNECKLPTNACTSNQSYTIDTNSNITCTNCGTNEIRDAYTPSDCVCKPNYSRVKHEISVGNTTDIGCQPNDNPCGTPILGSNYYWINDASSSRFQGFICKKCKDDDAIGKLGGCTCKDGYTRRSNDDDCINNVDMFKCANIKEPSGMSQSDSDYKYTIISMNNDFNLLEPQITCTICGSNQVRGPNSNTCVCTTGYIWKPNASGGGACVVSTDDICNTYLGSNIKIIGSNDRDTYNIFLGYGNFMSNITCSSCSGTQVANSTKTACQTCFASSNQYPNSNNSGCIQCSNNETKNNNDKCTCLTNFIYTEYNNSDLPNNTLSKCDIYYSNLNNLCAYDGINTNFSQYKYKFNTVSSTMSTDYGSKVICTKCTVTDSVRGSVNNSNNCVCKAGFYFYDSNGIPICKDSVYNPCELNQERVYGMQSNDVDGIPLSSGVMSNITCRACDPTTETYESKKCLCKAGYYRSNNGKCVQCGSGTYKPQLGDSTCLSCSNLNQYVLNSIECITCDPGSSNTGSSCVCASNYQIKSNVDGSKVGLSKGGSHCTPCLSGSYKLTPGDEFCSVCSIPGQYFNGTQCSNCPPNEEPNSTDTGCVPCANGYYKKSTDEKCSSTPCPANSIPKSDGTGCSNCLVGYKSGTNENMCTQCSSDSIPSSNGTGCVYCGLNQVRRSDSNLCQCAPNFIFNSTNNSCQSDLNPCASLPNTDNYYSYVITNSNKSYQSGSYDKYVTCTLCTKGSVRGTGENTNKCVCKSGYFNTKTDSCSDIANPCISSEVPVYSERSTDVNGVALQGGYTMSNVTCSLCGPNEKIEGISCVCVQGYYRDATNTCKPCSIGTYKDVSGNQACTACSGNSTTTAEGSSSCVCKAGYDSQGTLTNGGSHCFACSKGKYKDVSGNQPCTACTGSSYQDLTGQINCKTCGSGSNVQSNNTECVECGYGKYRDLSGLCVSMSNYQIGTTMTNGVYTGIVACPNTGVRGPTDTFQNRCICPNDMYYSLTDRLCRNSNLINTDFCLNKVKTYSSQTTDMNNINLTSYNMSNISCSSCASPTTYLDNACVCEKGYYLNGSTCTSCPAGKFKDWIGNQPCSNCSGTNQYQDQAGQTACKTCTANSISTADKKSCECLAGYYLKDSTCTLCPAGTFKNWTGNGSCSFCPGTNQYQDQTGQTACKTCTSNSTPTADKTSCVCLPGYGSTIAPIKDGSHCAICVPGTVKAGSNNYTCSQCLYQYQDLAGQTACKTCGQYSSYNSTNTGCICNIGYSDYIPDTGCTLSADRWNDSNQFANVLSDYDNNFSIHQMINPIFYDVIST